MIAIQERYKPQIEEMVSVCHQLAQDKYVTSHGGNISWAVDRTISGSESSNILITQTKKFKGDVKFDDICVVDYNRNILHVSGGGRPTGELPFHSLLFHERQDIVSIVHAHPVYTTAFAMSNKQNYLAWPILPEPTIEIGPVCIVPYAEPLTQQLADNFREYLGKYNAFLMANHGITVVGREGIERTRQLVDIIECTAASITAALTLGGIKTLTKKDVENLQNTMKTRNLPLPGKPGVWENLTDCYATAFKEIQKYVYEKKVDSLNR